jgi:F0F1-type ATP synthase assembly protein I
MRLLPLKRTTRSAAIEQTGATSVDARRQPSSASAATDSNHGIGRGMEFAVMVLLFFGVGYGLDRWFDTKPVFMIIFVVLAIVGQFASLYYGYDERMKAHEQRRAEAAQRGRTKLR